MISLTEIKPICIFLTETEKWVTRHEKGLHHFAERGIENILWVRGMHAVSAGLASIHPYEYDVHQEVGNLLPQKTTGGFVTAHIIYTLCTVLDYDYYLFLEDDARFPENWKEEVEKVLNIVPPDFDFIILGACCTDGKEKMLVAENVYEIKEAMCGHANIISKKAAQMIVDKCRDSGYPMDISLQLHVFPDAKVYAALPRIVEQQDMELPI